MPRQAPAQVTALIWANSQPGVRMDSRGGKQPRALNWRWGIIDVAASQQHLLNQLAWHSFLLNQLVWHSFFSCLRRNPQTGCPPSALLSCWQVEAMRGPAHDLPSATATGVNVAKLELGRRLQTTHGTVRVELERRLLSLEAMCGPSHASPPAAATGASPTEATPQ